MAQPPRPHPHFPEQEANGVDLSLILANLRLTPVERARRNEMFRQGVIRIRQYARRIDKKSA